jgi:hypothetical protein
MSNVKKLMASLSDGAIFWVIVLLAYSVVGFLRGRHTLRRWWAFLGPRRNFDL